MSATDCSTRVLPRTKPRSITRATTTRAPVMIIVTTASDTPESLTEPPPLAPCVNRCGTSLAERAFDVDRARSSFEPRQGSGGG